MNWRPADDPGPRYSLPENVQDEITCCELEALILMKLGDWNVWS